MAQQPSWSAAREGVVKSRASDTLAVFLAGTTGEEAAGGSALPRVPPLASSSIARRADPRDLENPRGGGGGAAAWWSTGHGLTLHIPSVLY